MRIALVVVFALCALPALFVDAAAQQPPPDSARSSMSGVYNEAQATRGRETYAYNCQSCHTPSSHTSPAFVTAWNGRPLLDLFGFIRENMPQNDPGILSAKEYAQVLAYLLQMNGMPAGPEELPTDAVMLRAIKFDTGR
jgi:mono/diheme cytochrome c family protein